MNRSPLLSPRQPRLRRPMHPALVGLLSVCVGLVLGVLFMLAVPLFQP